MGKRFIGLGHAVYIFALSNGIAIALGSSNKFIGQSLGHGALRSLPGKPDQPANRARGPLIGTNLYGDLVGLPAYPA